MSDEILFEQRGHAGVITLNRPKALNALTHEMAVNMHRQLEEWALDEAIVHVVIRGAGERAFCAGGDVRALYELGRAKDPSFLRFYWDEYRLNTLIKTYPKPFVALIHGFVMGGGVGVSIHGSHRVVAEDLKFAMPETGIGLFPDVGGSWFLPRLPGETGMYLGLTGARVGAEDAMWAGLATHHVACDKFDALVEALGQTLDVDGALDDFATRPEGKSLLREAHADIDRHFGHDSLEAILASLEGDNGEWAQRTATILRAKSPTSLKITFRQLREGARMSFGECMKMEYRIVNRIFEAEDFFEGVRALIIDKDNAPKWSPATLEEVSDATVERYFAPLERELGLDADV